MKNLMFIGVILACLMGIVKLLPYKTEAQINQHENDSLKQVIAKYKTGDSIWINYNEKLRLERTGNAKTITSDSCQKFHRRESQWQKNYIDWRQK